MKNVLRLVKDDLQNHKVKVTLPDETQEKSLYLIMIKALASPLEDIKLAYGEKVLPLHSNLISKLLGNKHVGIIYGVFLDENLEMIFAFNRDYAEYDSKKKVIIYKNLDEYVTEIVEKHKPQKPPKPEKPSNDNFDFPSSGFPFGGGGGSGLIRYSLIDPQEQEK